jgi:hypothetical protein
LLVELVAILEFLQCVCVATLALGSRPKQGFARLRAKKEAGSCTTYSWECEKLWGNEPSHPKGVPLWGVGVLVDFQIFRGRFQGSKLNFLRSFYINGKLLERKDLKWAMWAHLDIWNISYGQKKGRESNW